MQITDTDNFIASLGVEAYRVGGSVRDEIIGRKPKDADYIVCGIDLLDLVAAIRRIVTTRVKVTPLVDRAGQQFGWRVGKPYDIEIALPRREENAGEGRAMKIVADPTIPISEDAKRRDFTFNAIYKSIGGVPGWCHGCTPDNCCGCGDQLIDPTGNGLWDLQHRIVRTTHEDSFRDDPVRALRALRFVSRLGYDVDVETLLQMGRWASAVTGLTHNGFTSGTVFDEMSKVLMGDDVAKALRIGRDTGVLAAAFPELAAMMGHDPKSQYHDLMTDEHTFKALETAAKVDAPLRVRWALLFHDSGKPEVEWSDAKGNSHFYATAETEDHEVAGERRWRAAAARIGADKALREDVALLIRYHMVDTRGKFKPQKVRRMRVKFGDEMLRDLFMHRACDFSAKNKVAAADLTRIAWMEAERASAQAARVPSKLTDLNVDGKDAMRYGASGRNIGGVLRQLLDEVVVDPTEQKQTRDWQMNRMAVLVGVPE